MTWLTVTLLLIASACVTLTAIHAHVWFRQRELRPNAAFAVLASSVAAMAVVELRMAHADTVEAFGRALWWYHIPVWIGLVGVVCFVRLFLDAGRAWLGWMAIALRTLALVINVFSTPSINYREITSLEKVTIFGDPLTVVRGVPNPWLAVAQLSLVVLIAFVADAAWALWRRGERRRAVTIGGSLTLFITAGVVLAIISYWGLVQIPVFASMFFLPIVLAMGFELSLELTRSVRLATELTAKKAELQSSEDRLALAADAASAGLWSVDGATGQLWATPRALSMFGLAPDRTHHRDDMLASIHGDDRSRVRELLEGAVEDDRRSTIEYRVVDAHGETRWYASIGCTRRMDGESPLGLMGVTIDITERKRVEDETARQRVELEHLARVASLSEMSGALAHELKQPLAIIMSNAEAAQRLLEQRVPDLDEVRAILGDIVDADERAGEVITRLRGLLKRGAANPQSISLNQVVQAVLRLLRADLIRRGVTVELELPDTLGNVRADPVPIEQVLINIVGNACDAMAGNEPGERILKIVTAAEADSVHARIVDSGSGLPIPADRVFAPFYTTKDQGLGLGLAISRSIIAAHGGQLWAEANETRGATFHIRLPAATEPT